MLLTRINLSLNFSGHNLRRWDMTSGTVNDLASVPSILQPAKDCPQIQTSPTRQDAISVAVAQFAGFVCHIVQMNLRR